MNCCKCHIDLPNGGVVCSFFKNWETAPKYCKDCYFEYVVRPRYERNPDEIIEATDGEWITPEELAAEMGWENPGESLMRIEREAAARELAQRYR